MCVAGSFAVAVITGRTTMENNTNQQKGKRGFLTKTNILTVVAVGAVVLGCFLFSGEKPEPTVTDENPPPPKINTFVLQKTTLTQTITLNGKVDTTNSINVTTQADNEKIAEIPVKEGSKVTEGQIVMKLDATEILDDITKEQEKISTAKAAAQKKYDAAKSECDRAKTELDKANKELQAVKTLMDEAKKPYDNAVKTVSLQQADYDKAAGKEISERANVARAVMGQETEYAAVSAAKEKVTALETEKVNAEAAIVATEKVRETANKNVSEKGDMLRRADLVLADLRGRGETDPEIIKPFQDERDAAYAAHQQAIEEETAAIQAYDRAIVRKGEIEISLAAAVKDYDDKNRAFQLKAQKVAELKAGLTTSTANTENMLAILEQAKVDAKYEEYKNTYESARKEYDKKKSELKISTLEKDYSRAQTSLIAAEADLSVAGINNKLDELQKEYAACTVVSPANGVVTAINARVGEKAGGILMVIQDTVNLKFITEFKEDYINKIKTGTECTVVSNITGDRLAGYVSHIAPVAKESTTETAEVLFPCEITIKERKHNLRIGMTARAEIILEERQDVFAVPCDAVETGEDDITKIYVQGDNPEEFAGIPVATGMISAGMVEISAEGLQEGMVIRLPDTVG